MEYKPIFLTFIILFVVDRGCLAIGTKHTGFTVTCEVDISDPTYVMSFWRLERPSLFIYTYVPPFTFAPGADYTKRGLTFTNFKTVVFPSYKSTDVRKEDLTCFLSLNSSAYTCTDVKEQNIFAKPSVTLVSTPDLSNGVAADTEITIDITGKDYMCFEDPTFTVQIGSAPARPLTFTPPPASGDFSNFTASVTFTATEKENGNINVIMDCGGDSATITNGVEVKI